MDKEYLSKKIESGPLVLFLGQNYLKIDTNTDIFLKGILEKYSSTEIKDKDIYYNDIFSSSINDDYESSIAWIYRLANNISVPFWLENISKLNWSSIYTSAIDTIIERAFKNEWRDIQPAYDISKRISNPRDPIKLNLTYLFGCISQLDSDKRIPLNKLEKQKRLQQAIILAQRLPDIITPRGLFIVDGYDIINDWFPIENLYSIIERLSKNQTMIFNFYPSYYENEYIADLLKKDKIIPVDQNLSTLITDLEKEHLLRIIVPEDTSGFGKWINIEGRKVKIPKDIYNRIRKSAIVLDEKTIDIEEFLDDDQYYYLFRSFLSDSGLIPKWSGYLYDFAFKRDYLENIKNQINKKLNYQDYKESPVILFGQSGAGKTMMLGQLAVDLIKDVKCPVLFIEKSFKKPDETDIDVFCEWAEQNNAKRTIVIWDGLQDAEQYEKLQKRLDARGRKVIVVGSTYKKEDDISKSNYEDNPNYIEACIDLNLSEKDRFSHWLKNHLKYQIFVDNVLKEVNEKNFLILLYRFLPSSRRSLKEGLSQEANFFSQWVIKKAIENEPEIELTGMAELLIKSGLTTYDEVSKISKSVTIEGEDITLPQQLVYLIMVPGQYGLKVPFDLIIRCMGADAFNSNIFNEIQKTDIFRWYEDSSNNIYLGPRTSLEAKLIVKYLGHKRSEFEYIKKLLQEIRYSSLYGIDHETESLEIQFAVELLQQIGPNSENRIHYDLMYELTFILKNLRETKSAHHPRLVLKEVSFLREIAKQNLKIDETPIQLLDKAESIIDEQLESMKDSRKNQIYNFFKVEKAAILGSKIQNAINMHQDSKALFNYYNAAKESLISSRASSPENYHALDVLCWSTIDILKTKSLSDLQSLELGADVLHMLDIAEFEGVNESFEKQLLLRKSQIGSLINRQDISDNALKQLQDKGSLAGYYFNALNILNKNHEIFLNEVLDIEKGEDINAAFEYLKSNYKIIKEDSRCLYLYLRLWWLIKTHKPLFYKERQTFNFTESDWLFCLEITQELLNTSKIYFLPTLLFIKAICLFHLNQFKSSIETFRELDDESDYSDYGRKRVIKSYVYSLPTGKPKLVSGQVRYTINKNIKEKKGEMYVPEILEYIPFFLSDFNTFGFEKGETVTDFVIAFNFRGPLAIRSI